MADTVCEQGQLLANFGSDRLRGAPAKKLVTLQLLLGRGH